MRSHGSGQACFKARAAVKCDECRAYSRVRLAREMQKPGTYRHSARNGLGPPGDKHRQAERRRQDAADHKELAKWQS